MMRRWLVCAALLASCGDDSEAAVDARPADGLRADGPPVDARSSTDAPIAPDAAPDAPASDAALPIDAAPPIDATLADAVPVDPIFCSSDDVTGRTSGSRAVSASGDIIALCSGNIVRGDRVTNRIVIENVFDASTLASMQLPSAPGPMDLDRAHGVLYVTLSPATLLARVDLAAQTVTTLPLPQTAIAVAAGPAGKAFVIGDDLSGFSMRTLFSVDVATGNAVPVLSGLTMTVVAYDPAGQQLFANANSNLYRYSVDVATGMLTLVQTQPLACAPQLTISPLGGHLACAGGADQYGGVDDFDANDLARIRGDWLLASYPSGGGSFAPDGASIALSEFSSGRIDIFSVATHALARTYSNPINCPAGFLQITRLAYSRGGRVVYAYQTCSSSGTPYLSWFILP